MTKIEEFEKTVKTVKEAARDAWFGCCEMSDAGTSNFDETLVNLNGKRINKAKAIEMLKKHGFVAFNECNGWLSVTSEYARIYQGEIRTKIAGRVTQAFQECGFEAYTNYVMD